MRLTRSLSSLVVDGWAGGWRLVLLARTHSFHFHFYKNSLRRQNLTLRSSLHSSRPLVGSVGTGRLAGCMPVVGGNTVVGGVESPFGCLAIGTVVASPSRFGVLF